MKKRSRPAGDILARNVLRYRRDRELSQWELSARARVTQALVSTVEAGRANPTLRSIERMAAALGVSVADLFKTADER